MRRKLKHLLIEISMLRSLVSDASPSASHAIDADVDPSSRCIADPPADARRDLTLKSTNNGALLLTRYGEQAYATHEARTLLLGQHKYRLTSRF